MSSYETYQEETLSYRMYQKLVNFLFLNREQLILADKYVERKLSDFITDKEFEFFNDLKLYIFKCFNVLKLQNNTRLGLSVCNNRVVDLLIDYEHEFCPCSKVTFGLKLKEI